jgi:L-rhamnose mutarotase
MKKKNSIEKTGILRRYCLSFIIAVMTAVTVYSQNIPSLFVVVDFMKVEPENHASYLQVEQEIWKPMHQERINEGIIVGWYLYAVEFSGGMDDYNYVVITLYDNADQLENPWSNDIPGKVHPGKRLEEMMQRTYESRTHVRSELFYSIATAPAIPMETPAPYMQVNFMKVEPQMASGYEQLEKEIWLPIHNESIRSGRTTGWGLWSSLFPRGSGLPYQYITLNAFSEYSYIFDLDFSIPFSNIHPDKDFKQTQERTREVRSIVRTELWDLIDYVIR